MEKSEKEIALTEEVEILQRQLQEANDTIEAIRTGQIDALVVHVGESPQLYTLQSADHIYRVFVEKMNEGAVTLNRNGIIQYSNSYFSGMLQRPLSTIIGTSFRNLVYSHDITAYDDLWQRCWADEGKIEVKLLGTHAKIPVQLSISVLEATESETASIIITDLTSIKAKEHELRGSNAQLATLNASLAASNHDLQQFASIASHDLQEPLRKILLFANRIIAPLDEQSRTTSSSVYLQKIVAAAERMRTLIVNVLDYSSLSMQDGPFVSTNINAIVRDIVEDLELVIAEKRATISVSPIPALLVNPGQIRQLFQNLLSNALKFTKNGIAPVIDISAYELREKNFDSEIARDGEFCLLRIEDNGIGLEEQYAASIFSLFERLHPKDSYEGTGIGLAIAKKIVDKHHGLIRVKSKLGQGSAFEIILPKAVHSSRS